MHQILVSEDTSVMKIKRLKIILIKSSHRLRIYADSHRTYEMRVFPKKDILFQLHEFHKSESIPVKS